MKVKEWLEESVDYYEREANLNHECELWQLASIHHNISCTFKLILSRLPKEALDAEMED